MGRASILGLLLVWLAPLRGDESWFDQSPADDPPKMTDGEYGSPEGHPTFGDMARMSEELEAARVAKEAAEWADLPDAVITHEEVQAAAEAAEAAKKWEHHYAFRDLGDGTQLKDVIDANPSANAFVVYFHKPSCEHCTTFNPILSDAIDLFEKAYPAAEVHWLAANADAADFGEIGAMYEVVEFPTLMFVPDLYAEPSKYEGGWASADEVARYAAAFVDAHPCDRVSGAPAVDLAPGSVRVALGDDLRPNARAVAWVEATNARESDAGERDVRVVCGGSGTAVTVQRNFPSEPDTVAVEMPTEGDDATKRTIASIFRERLRRAVAPAVTEITNRTQYATFFAQTDALGIVHFRPNATNATIRKTLKDARALARAVPETTRLRLTYCRLDAPDLDDAANHLCSEMAQYTLPRFHTTGGAGFVILDLGVAPEKPTLCKTEVEIDANDRLTPHMKYILREKEKRQKKAYAAYGTLRKFALKRSFTRKAAAAFLDEFVTGDMTEAFLSDKIPEKHLNPGPFFMLVGDTFEDFVTTEDDVLVYIVQRDCWACHQLWDPVWSVVQLFADEPRIKFASIDNRVNDIQIAPWANVNATPAILFLPGGADPEDVVEIPHRTSVDAKGNDKAILSVKAMAQTILDTATHAFANRADLEEDVAAMAHSA